MSERTHLEKRQHTPIDIIRERLARGEKVLFPGGVGALLHDRGIETKLPLWSASALLSESGRKVVHDIHREYIDAGAEVITTNTFRTNVRKFWEAGLTQQDAYNATVSAVRAAQRARTESGRSDIPIGGSVGPVEECYEPDRVPSDAELKEEHGLLAWWLKEAGVDFIAIETINTIREARIAAEAARNEGLPFTISFVCDVEGNLLSGEPIEAAVEAIKDLEPIALCTNCRSAHVIQKSVERLLACSPFPVGVYANGGGEPNHETNGWHCLHENPEEDYAYHADEWLEKGVQIVGGCCGTTPAHVRAVRARFSARSVS